MNWKNLTWKHLFVVLLLLHIIPLWIFNYFPSQDGPSHVYNAFILKEYHKHENYKLRDVFKLNITIFPNWLSHLALALLLYVFPPIVSEKIFLTVTVGLLPVSFFYFLSAVRKRELLFGWLGFLFSYNYLLFMGFYSFILSISFFFFSFGYWWKHKDSFRVNQIGVLYFLLVATYLSHIFSYGLILLSISVVALCLWVSAAVVETWRERHVEGMINMVFSFAVKLKPLIRFVGYMLPAYFIFVEYLLRYLQDYRSFFLDKSFIPDYFWGVKSLVYFTDWHVNIHRGLLCVLGAAIVISLIYRLRRKQWLQQTDVFLVITLLCTVMFIRAPWGNWLIDRSHFYILPMLTPWLIPYLGKVFRLVFTIALVVICLAHLGRSTYDIAHLNREIDELTSGIGFMEPHTTYSIRSPDWYKSDSLGSVKYVTPFLHAVSFYGLANKDIVHLANYEADHAYFPINFKEKYNGSVDYVVSWAYPEEERFADLTPNYDLIHKTKNLKLFRIKQANEPNQTVWGRTPDGRLIIHFDMQPEDGETAAGYHPIGKNTSYVSGKFGWVTRSPHNDFHGEMDLSALDRDFVWDTDDAAFKLDLASGTYRVTNYFCSAEDAVHQVNLLANGKQVIKGLVVPKSKKAIEDTYTFTATQGHLTQVIYVPRKRVVHVDSHDHWIWSGFTVEQLSAVNVR